MLHCLLAFLFIPVVRKLHHYDFLLFEYYFLLNKYIIGGVYYFVKLLPVFIGSTLTFLFHEAYIVTWCMN